MDQREILTRERDVLFSSVDVLTKTGSKAKKVNLTIPEIPKHVTDIELRELIEEWTGGKETVLFDKDGVPSVKDWYFGHHHKDITMEIDGIRFHEVYQNVEEAL